jgi:pimeloyl-ACP methyl ester carboxylesterase
MLPMRRAVSLEDRGPDRISGASVDLDCGRYQVWSAGNPHDPAVLLIHGLGWDALCLWQDLMLRLSAGGWYVLAPDLLGVGGSSPLSSPQHGDRVAADLVDVLARLGVRDCAVAGFSMGGTIAMEMAMRAPAIVRAVALCCCSAARSAGRDAATAAMLARAATLGPEAFAREQAAAIWHPDWARSHPARVAEFVAWRAAMDQESLFNAFRSNDARAAAPEPAAVTIPALVVAADTDSFVPVEEARDLARALPSADFVLIEECGHMAPIERPEAFGDALTAFLSRVWPPRRVGAA